MKRKKRLWITIVSGILILATGAATAAADEPERFRSKGSIRYQDSGGQEIIWDAGDLDVLFQYAAEGKSGLSKALGGVGTKLIKEEEWQFTRNPQTEGTIASIETVQQMQEISFDFLLQALEESQTLPAEYTEKYVLASSDNLTLGRAAWADGSLLRGNNHDLIESYLKGWLEGSGCKEYEAVYDEEGRWIGYRGKET
ncbi:MAG: hypothetical protein J6K48_01475 [Lachnospiraceae bacterium]|nr:hypothetical protein [Lachnospiraceae bacterium]